VNYGNSDLEVSSDEVSVPPRKGFSATVSSWTINDIYIYIIIYIIISMIMGSYGGFHKWIPQARWMVYGKSIYKWMIT